MFSQAMRWGCIAVNPSSRLSRRPGSDCSSADTRLSSSAATRSKAYAPHFDAVHDIPVVTAPRVAAYLIKRSGRPPCDSAEIIRPGSMTLRSFDGCPTPVPHSENGWFPVVSGDTGRSSAMRSSAQVTGLIGW